MDSDRAGKIGDGVVVSSCIAQRAVVVNVGETLTVMLWWRPAAATLTARSASPSAKTVEQHCQSVGAGKRGEDVALIGQKGVARNEQQEDGGIIMCTTPEELRVRSE